MLFFIKFDFFLILDYISIIRPKFNRFNITIGELCNEARRGIWQLNPHAEFDIDGVIHKKPIKIESLAINNQLTTIMSSNNINEIQNLINYERATTSSNDKCNFHYITSSEEILNGEYSTVIEDSSRDSPF